MNKQYKNERRKDYKLTVCTCFSIIYIYISMCIHYKYTTQNGISVHRILTTHIMTLLYSWSDWFGLGWTGMLATY